jgi:hypothetical protein
MCKDPKRSEKTGNDTSAAAIPRDGDDLLTSVDLL